MKTPKPIIHGQDHRPFNADQILDTAWITVGSGGDAPGFEGTWTGTVKFIMATGGWTVISGMPTGGSSGETVFFLPARYRPADDVEDICRGEEAGDISFWKVQAADGAVVYEGSGSVTVS